MDKIEIKVLYGKLRATRKMPQSEFFPFKFPSNDKKEGI